MNRWESVVERRIREAQERGEFDDLPGAGKPIEGIGEPYDENWWVRNLLRRERTRLTGGPAPVAALRKEIAALPARLDRLTLESSVRDIVTDLNARILRIAAGALDPVDVDGVVAAWRARR